ncbi:MAG: phosphoribosylamine--glycine ligase [Defluviitaleaceae bacterium]|nr:phosphoribosylamine--glycine ligase [Defluviitaleaceae bacterium]
MKKVLIIGRGGREHALAIKFSESAKVYAAPGNVGMENIAKIVNIDENDFEGLINFVKKENISLTFVGPEVPLVNGIVDEFEKENLTIFGPNKKAAMIEGSKAFAKELMQKYNIPTAKHETFTEVKKAMEYIKENKITPPYVLKADGLAAGKGVVISESLEEAEATLKEMIEENKFGEASNKVVIEEFLEGCEFSFMAFVNGENVYPLELAKDHKRAYDKDEGPNTGGMGAYSPVPIISNETVKIAIKDILQKTAKAMVAENCPFKGVLYAGLIDTKEGAKVIEFNARFGDPETEVLLPRLESDLYEVIMSVLKKEEITLKWSNETTVGVVLASGGYPNSYKTNIPINIKDTKDVTIYHCGTKNINDKLVTAGGRVLLVTAKESNLKKAREKVYEEIKKINFEGIQYRKDIGLNMSKIY